MNPQFREINCSMSPVFTFLHGFLASGLALVVHCLTTLPHFQANLFHDIHCIQKSVCSLFPSTKFFATSEIS